MTGLIRSPARCNHRNPNSAVLRFFAPYAIVVEILVADGSLGNVASGKGTVLALVADRAPIVETIIGRRFGFGMSH
jgi:hypothetical protein